MAEQGLVFQRAWSPTPIPLPSHASLLTGTYPTVHGVFSPSAILPDAALTLAEMLKNDK